MEHGKASGTTTGGGGADGLSDLPCSPRGDFSFFFEPAGGSTSLLVLTAPIVDVDELRQDAPCSVWLMLEASAADSVGVLFASYTLDPLGKDRLTISTPSPVKTLAHIMNHDLWSTFDAGLSRFEPTVGNIKG